MGSSIADGDVLSSTLSTQGFFLRSKENCGDRKRIVTSISITGPTPPPPPRMCALHEEETPEPALASLAIFESIASTLQTNTEALVLIVSHDVILCG